MAPFSGTRRPKISVAPGEYKLIPYKMTDANACISFKIRATFSKGRQQVARKTMEKGSKQVRKNAGQDVGIYVYTARAANAIVMEYVNESSSYKLMETISFELQNCKIQGKRRDTLNINLTPGETEVYRIVPIDAQRDFNARARSCKYAVIDAKSSFAFN